MKIADILNSTWIWAHSCCVWLNEYRNCSFILSIRYTQSEWWMWFYVFYFLFYLNETDNKFCTCVYEKLEKKKKTKCVRYKWNKCFTRDRWYQTINDTSVVDIKWNGDDEHWYEHFGQFTKPLYWFLKYFFFLLFMYPCWENLFIYLFSEYREWILIYISHITMT